MIKIKIVEKAGNKIVDLLHKSNGWSNEDCEREDCIVCSSAIDEENARRNCKRRSITYETFCLICQAKDKEEERKKKESNEVKDEDSEKDDRDEEIEMKDDK